ncbi:MAG: Asp-tRNA(Asn)/Glu-tRNA(Gln) amidotransferase subunit GatC [Candidatus Jorgensenbacteria bacterium]
MLSEKDVTHLAELARIALAPEEKKSLLKDLGGILAYFEELKAVDTEGVRPIAGGTSSMNVVREDTGSEPIPNGLAVEAFPEAENGFLKVPPVFSAEGGSASGGE